MFRSDFARRPRSAVLPTANLLQSSSRASGNHTALRRVASIDGSFTSVDVQAS